jgi:DNA invertase Pin-like site-specific DNA recombinase
MIRLIAYIRMSTDRQVDSPATQELLIREACKRFNLKLVRIFLDPGVSASKTRMVERPEGAKLLAEISKKKRNFDGVMFLRLDRAFRDLDDQRQVLDYMTLHNCEVWTTEGRVDYSTPHTRFSVTVLGAVNELHAEIIGQMIKDHNISQVMQGLVPCGKPPMGLSYNKVTKKITVNERATDVLRVFELFVRNNCNMCQTAYNLNTEGVKTSTGKLWNTNSVKRLLVNPYYRQKVHFLQMQVYSPDTIPRIVPEQWTDIVDKIFAGRQIPPRAKGSTRTYSGLMTCSECGFNMIGVASGNSRQVPKKSYSWCCSRRLVHSCPTRRVAEPYIDKLVGKALAILFEKLRQAILQNSPVELPSAEHINARRMGLTKQREAVAEAYMDNAISRERYKQKLSEIDQKLLALDKEPEQPASVSQEDIDNFIDFVGDKWAAVPQEEKKNLLYGVLNASVTVGAVKGATLWLELETPMYPAPIRVDLPGSGTWSKRKEKLKAQGRLVYRNQVPPAE